MDKFYIGGIDIGGTKIAAAVAGPDGPMIRLVQPTAKTGKARALPEQTVSLLEAACERAGITKDALKAVGVSSCGPFATVDGLLNLATPNICGGRTPDSDLPNDWVVIPLEQVLREHFEHVVIENDCVAALIAERTYGALQDVADCAYVTWSTGIGFALCVDGHVLRGKHGNAGHAGHMLMSESDPAKCGCGNVGDVEALCSGRHLGKRLNMSASDLLNAAHAGDKAALEEVRRAAQWFGRALYNLTATLDTRCFAIGGTVWMYHGDLLLPIVRHEIESRLPALTEGVSIVRAALGRLAPDIGSLCLVSPPEWQQHWRQTSPWQKLM
jgi:glucokinase